MAIHPYVDLKNFHTKINKIKVALNDPSDVFKYTFKDIKSRAPGGVADAVRNVYNIKKNEITPKSKSAKSTPKKAGSIFAVGTTIENFKMIYYGRVLTPLHFGMTPKIRPKLEGKKNKKYKIKLNIKKQQKVLKGKSDNSPFLAPVRSGYSKQIPWERFSNNRDDIRPVKTLSVPQMVDNKIVRETIDKTLGELLEKRFQHHLNNFINKKIYWRDSGESDMWIAYTFALVWRPCEWVTFSLSKSTALTTVTQRWVKEVLLWLKIMLKM